MSKWNLYKFQEAQKMNDSNALVPFGATFMVSAKSEEEAKEVLPKTDAGVFWTLVSEK